jgi:IS30 family transposase
LIIGKDQRSAIGKLVERRVRMVRLLHLLQRDGEASHDALKARMADLPAASLRSITWDQGAEMARHLHLHRACIAARECRTDRALGDAIRL